MESLNLKKALRLFVAAVSGMMFFACTSPSDEAALPEAAGTYILNNGNWGSNDANIGIYDPVEKSFAPDVFYKVNSQKLGDLGQDMISHAGNLFIAVNGSQTIFMTGPDLKIKSQINADNNGARLSPRSFAVCGDRVYVTYYEGYVGEIRSEEGSVRLCKVGPNPDGIAAAGGSLYVANSGGMAYPAYNNTVSVVSASSFTETSTIKVNLNPAFVEASSDGRYVYVSSYGNYADVAPKLQIIETSTGKVSDLDYQSVSSIAKGKGDVLYILCGGYDENWNPLPGKIYRHDMSSNTKLGEFVKDAVQLPDAYSISAASDGYVYVGCSDYKTTGDVYVFNENGMLHDRFDSHGLNPLKTI